MNVHDIEQQRAALGENMTQPKNTTTKMLVTISGSWLENGEQVTPAMIERSVREALRDEFEFLASKVTVRRIEGDGE